MNKHILSINGEAIISDLPKLPFARISNARDIPHESLSNLPHGQINLVDMASATAARVLLRFDQVTLDEQTDAGVAVTLLGAWVKKLVEGMNAKHDGVEYKLAMPNNADRPYMPPMQQGGWGNRPYGAMSAMDPRGSRWPGARPFDGSFNSFAVPQNLYAQGDYEAVVVAQSLLRDISTSTHQSAPSLSVIYTTGKERSYMRFEGSLGEGVTFSANPVPQENEMGYISFLESVKEGGTAAGFFHVAGTKYLYTTGHQHGYADELRTLLTVNAVGIAFNKLWEQQHEAMGQKAHPVHFDAL